jgi:hypothetical protein
MHHAEMRSVSVLRADFQPSRTGRVPPAKRISAISVRANVMHSSLETYRFSTEFLGLSAQGLFPTQGADPWALYVHGGPAFSTMNRHFSASRMAHSDSRFNMERLSPPAKLSVLAAAVGPQMAGEMSPLPCPRKQDRIEASRAGSRTQWYHRGLAERMRKRLATPLSLSITTPLAQLDASVSRSRHSQWQGSRLS